MFLFRTNGEKCIAGGWGGGLGTANRVAMVSYSDFSFRFML